MNKTNNMRAIFIKVALFLSAAFVAAGGDERYAAADRRALNTPAWAEESIESLSGYLTKPFTSDEDKARAVFRWITENISYDVEGYLSKSFSSDCKDVLRSRSSVCGGYSDLFEALCRKAGVEAVTIGGSSKGFSYHAGDDIEKMENHAWNAVKIRGTWKLVDCTWGAGKVDAEYKYSKEFEPYYFMTKPEEFVYRHFPREEKWQLLARPISRGQFEDLPLVTPVYFQCNLKLTGKQLNSIDVSGEYIADISAPSDVLITATLEQDERISEDAVFVQRSGTTVALRITPPASGNYFLHIYAKRGNAIEKVPLAASFKIIAHAASVKSSSYPTIFKTYVETGAQLQSPLTKELVSGSMQFFSITCPQAEKVAVVYEDEWDFLKKYGSKFEGSVEIGPGKINVVAMYPEGKDFDALLEYTGTGTYLRARGPIKYDRFMKSAAEVLSPLKKELPAGTTQVFRVKLPGAKKAAVIIGEEWKYLEKNGDYFEGTIGISSGKILVVGAYSEKKEFDGLLEYEAK